MSLRLLLLFAVHLKVHLLVEEGQVVFDLAGLWDRLRIVSDEILDPLAADLDRVVGGYALVPTLGLLVAED